MKTLDLLKASAVAFLLAAVFRSSAAEPAATGPWEKYFWQTCLAKDIAPSADKWKLELRAEVQSILDSGPLAPLRTVYADLEQDPYFLYWQGGRIITTLAMAWPYLTAAQQTAAQSYIRAELDDENRAPWTPKGFIPPDQGARREFHSFHEARGWERYWGMWGKRKPTMGSFYGLWL